VNPVISPMDSQNRVKKTGKARIPDHLRRRALVSCDRCKKRRIRCLRSSGDDSCQSCLEVGVNCESTLPRKTRIYGSVETLSLRYRVLDALIKGLYPHKDTNSIETLYAIAEANNVTLPTFDEQSVAEEVFSQPRQSVGGSPDSAPLRSPSLISNPSDAVPRHEDPPGSPPVVEEKLVPLPRGPSHYIGPSSSFGFVLTVRSMVAEFNAALKNIQPDDERTKLSSDFAKSNWSKALEPIVKAESDTSSDNEQSPAGQRQNRGFYKPPVFTGPTGLGSVPRSAKPTLLSLLPTREVSDAFIEAYFNQVHPNYLLFHRPTFQNRYEAMWANPGRLVKDEEAGWVCSVCMMLVFGAQALEDRDKAQSIQIQHHYLDLVQKRLHSLISATTLINVQALLLLQLYQHNNTERNSAFMLLGCASRMAMALGMHREGTSGGFDALEREVRKRVWWTVYIFEANQCAILGRPCAIDDHEVNVSFPDEKLLDNCASVPAHYVEYFVQITKLMSLVRRKIYASPASPTKHGDHPKIPVAIQFLLDLDSWFNSLPPELHLENSSSRRHQRAVTLLHIQFHHTRALVARPFILRKVNVQLARKLGKHVRSQDLDKEEIQLSQACGDFSRKAVVLLNRLLVKGMFDGVAWLDAYYIYHAVFILALDFLARPWDDQETAEDRKRKTAVRDVTDALQNVKLCPTFTVLTQVALQLAKIVGIFDVSPPPNSAQHLKTESFPAYPTFPPPPQPSGPHSHNTYQFSPAVSQPDVSNVVNTWFQKGPQDLPWDMRDFFGGDGFVGPGLNGGFTDVPMPLGHTFDNQMGGIGEEDLAPPLPTGLGYTHWGGGGMDNAFAQQPGRGGGVFKGPQ
jgi:proline utilization trans-activator